MRWNYYVVYQLVGSTMHCRFFQLENQLRTQQALMDLQAKIAALHQVQPYHVMMVNWKRLDCEQAEQKPAGLSEKYARDAEECE